MKTHYLNGLKEGKQFEYYPNVTLTTESNHKKGELHGKYYENGRIETIYQNGEETGLEYHYNEDGSLVEIINHDEN